MPAPRNLGETGPAGVAGPLQSAVTSDGTFVQGRTGRFTDDANALVLMRRVAFVEAGGTVTIDAKSAARALLGWAVDHGLGQEARLLAAVHARRTAMLAAAGKRGLHVVRLRVTPEWRLAVGLGNRANPHEIGLSLHGTYGWPVIPGSSIKGLASSWAEPRARAGELDPALFDVIFGTPRIRPVSPERPGSPRTAARGSVRFLDAIPAGEPVTVARDVVTPHVQPYYTAANRDDTPVPPAEYHQPVPSEFLVVSGGRFAVDLLGPADQVTAAADWCAAAFDDLGIGGKTGAGYGYATTVKDDT